MCPLEADEEKQGPDEVVVLVDLLLAKGTWLRRFNAQLEVKGRGQERNVRDTDEALVVIMQVGNLNRGLIQMMMTCVPGDKVKLAPEPHVHGEHKHKRRNPTDGILEAVVAIVLIVERIVSLVPLIHQINERVPNCDHQQVITKLAKVHKVRCKDGVSPEVEIGEGLGISIEVVQVGKSEGSERA